MRFDELVKQPKFFLATNIKLTLYKLAEELGIPKEDILAGVYDEHLDEAQIKIINHVKKYQDQVTKEGKQ